MESQVPRISTLAVTEALWRRERSDYWVRLSQGRQKGLLITRYIKHLQINGKSLESYSRLKVLFVLTEFVSPIAT